MWTWDMSDRIKHCADILEGTCAQQKADCYGGITRHGQTVCKGAVAQGHQRWTAAMWEDTGI